jgi:tetratricopeptide (TPR) repeat protein
VAAGGTASAPEASPPGLPKLRRGAAPPASPTPEQQRALRLLRQEAREYELGARDFRNTLTIIVRHHYEQKRRRILAALDREIALEKQLLVETRNEAIRRLEEFIAHYSGANAHRSATPDAMFRLAALYEERAREDFEAELAPRLKPAVDLYRRIIRDYPDYEEIAAVHYFLGHAYTDSNRFEQGQQAWRALVCANRFTVRADSVAAGRIAVDALPQDHDQKFWTQWYNKNPLPLDQIKVKGFARRVDPATALEEEELLFRDPYPEDCVPLPQQLQPGEQPRYLAEVWWQIGNYHFDHLDPGGGPFNLNRAASAYRHALRFTKPPLYGVALYKQAWTSFKQQRYRAAVEQFVQLLDYTDEQERKTGDPGADFRGEAYTYIAGAVTYVDLDGPPPDHPYIPRADVLDLESDPLVAEQKMAVAIERVQDPSLIPQDRKWTAEVYKSLAQEFIDITQNRNAIAVLELTLQRFPMDRDAPVMQNKVAELYDELSRLSPEGSAAREEYAVQALAARTQLAGYVGATPWTDANRNDPEALRQAEQLVRTGLKRAAADHTNFARHHYQKARELSDAGEQQALLQKAIAEYRLAETGWAAYLGQDPNAFDSYETQFWLADARYWVVVLQVLIGQTPSQQDVEAAVAAAQAVRDSNQDDKYLQPAAYYMVSVYDKVLEQQYRLFRESRGARGIEERTEVRFSGEGKQRQVVRSPLPPEMLAANDARDAYNACVPLDRDPEHNGLLYAFQVAQNHFLYGHFEAARRRFEPLYQHYCGKNQWGYLAWERLISMANFERNADESRRLAAGKSCAIDAETRAQEDSIRKPVKQGVAYLDARTLYEQAEQTPSGPERDKKWREAAAAYKVALDAAPDRDEAPEAAMNGAYAYKQVGEYDKAIQMYQLFIARYGDTKTLARLQAGDPQAQPPLAPSPAQYAERTKYLKSAYDALAGAYVLFFDYPRAAGTFDTISTNQHFSGEHRRAAALQALGLYASLGDPGGMDRARQRLRELGASAPELAEADFTVASAELKKWDEFSPNEGANAAARRRALRAMVEYYERHQRNMAARQWVVHAAYWAAKLHRAAASPVVNTWWTNTIRAFERYKASAPRKEGRSTALGSPEAGMAAEAEYTMIDAALAATFDYETGHHHYKGTTVEVIREYRADAVTARQWHTKLQHAIDAHLSPKWTIAALARQGSLYDSLRTGLYSAREPALRMFDAKTEQALKRAEESGNPELEEKADEIRMKVRTAWRNARERELHSADAVVVKRYGQAVVLARRYNVSAAAVTRAIRRLAYFTDVIGEAKLAQYAASVADLNYAPGMFLRRRPGLVTAPRPQGMPRPLPALVP